LFGDESLYSTRKYNKIKWLKHTSILSSAWFELAGKLVRQRKEQDQTKHFSSILSLK